MYPPHLWTLSSSYVAVSKSYHVLRKVHIIPILVFFNTFLPLSRPSTQLNHLGPSHSTTCSHLPFRSNWSGGKAADLINTANVPISPFLQPPFLPTSSPLLHPNSLRLLLHPNSLQTVPASTLVSLGIDWIILAEFFTSPYFLLSTTRPTASRRFLPHPPHSLYLFRSSLFQTKSPVLEPQLLPTPTQVNHPFQSFTFLFPSTPIPPRFDKTENLALFPSPSLEYPHQSPQQLAHFADLTDLGTWPAPWLNPRGRSAIAMKPQFPLQGMLSVGPAQSSPSVC